MLLLYPTLKQLFVLFHFVFTLISDQAIIVFLHSLFRSAVIQTPLMSELIGLITSEFIGLIMSELIGLITSELIGLMAQLRVFLLISA
jgi:hypothetical protein